MDIKKYIKIITGIILLLTTLRSYSQGLSPEDANEKKYWIWRDRLVNDFMVPGNGVGCGIIMTKRGGSFVKDYNGGFTMNDEGWPRGYYLAVLATEWKLLHDAGQSTEQTDNEIYYALKSFDRLDNDAEGYWMNYWGNDYPVGGWSNDNPNGFMIRDDVFDESEYNGNVTFVSPTPNATGYNNFMHLNSNNGIAGKYVPQSILPQNNNGNILSLTDWAAVTVSSDFPNGYRPGAAASGIHNCDGLSCGHIEGPEESSLDHYVGMMIGLCTLIKCLPDGYVMQHPPDNCSAAPEYFNTHAKNILSRIIHYMQNSYDLYHKDNDDNPLKKECDNLNCWVLTNPITGMCIKGVDFGKYLAQGSDLDDCHCNEGGSSATVLSGHFTNIYNTYVNNGAGDISDCKSYLELHAAILGGALGLATNFGLDLTFGVTSDAAGAALLGSALITSIAMGNNIAQVYDNKNYSTTLYALTGDEGSAYWGWKKDHIGQIASMDDQLSTSFIDEMDAKGTSEYKFLDLLKPFLLGGSPYRGHDGPYYGNWGAYYDDFLTTFPCLDTWDTIYNGWTAGPYQYDNNLLNEIGYSNMLPQMLTHNLLKLLRGHSYSFPQGGGVDINDNNNYPYTASAGIQGTSGNSSCAIANQKVILTAQNIITSNSAIGQLSDGGCTWNGWVQYIAGQKITLQQGFNVSNGAYFDAKLGLGDCQVKQGGDYSWNYVCEECDYPATAEDFSWKVEMGTVLCAGRNVTFTPGIDQPVRCYHNVDNGYYKWIIQDPDGSYEQPVYTSYSYMHLFEDEGDYYVSEQYCDGPNCSNTLGPYLLHVLPESECDGWQKTDSTSDKRAVSDTSKTGTNNNDKNIISVYPNPTDGIFTVSCSNANTAFSVEVTNVLGGIVYSANNISNKTQIDLTMQTKGIYIVKTITSGGTESFVKVIYQ